METLNKKIAFLVILSSFAITQTSSAIITRNEMIHIAESYKTYLWVPTEDNICNNKCCVKWNEKGECTSEVNCSIDTPDRNTNTAWAGGKGWKAEKNGEDWVENISVPYQWGGCSSIEVDGIDLKDIRGYGNFKEGVESKKCAGDFDCSTPDLQKAVGIDCSGFVSRCWNQGTKYGTSTIPRTFRKLEKYEHLRTGDALNKRGHVMLFKEFIPDEDDDEESGEENGDEELPEELKVYEASANDWKVWNRDYNIKDEIKNIYKPYSFYKQIDIDLVIDRSGSMRGDKMSSAKSAAKMFVSMMGERDKIGVVSFSSSALVDYDLTEITKYSKDEPSEIKREAIRRIDRIFPGGGTSIGAGMQAGFDQLKTRGLDFDYSPPKKDDVRAMLLMSDGHSSSVEGVLNKIVAYNNTYKNNKIKVCTIGFGSGADHELLSDIASKTDCSYQYAANLLDLYFTYRSFQMEVAGEDMLKLSNKIRILKEEVIRQFVFVDSTVGTTTIAIAWESSDLDLTLIRPDGTIVDHDTNDLDIEFVEGDTYEFYKINAPMHGEWEMVIEAIDVPEGGEDFILTVSGENAMIFEANLDKQKYMQNEEITITAFAQDPVVDSDDPQYVTEVSFEVEITAPSQTIPTLQLYDDGTHNDGGANDGIYANIFSGTQESGSYTFNVKASGNTNRAGDPFTREKSISTFVAENLSPVADANGPYFGYAGIKIIFDASDSTDPGNQPLKYRWDFNNDNIFETDWLINSTAEYVYYNSYLGKALLEVSNGNLTDIAIAEVEIKSAKQLKEETVASLEEAKTGDKKTDKKIDDVLKNITKSLRDDLWEDEIHLNPKKGNKVFVSERTAIARIEFYLNRQELSGNVFEEAIKNLVLADKIIAQVILSEAKDTSVKSDKQQKNFEKMIAKAEKEINQAQEYENSDPAKAVKHYWQSWKYSQKAIQEAGKK